MNKRRMVVMLLMLIVTGLPAEPIVIANFDTEILREWQHRRFAGETEARIVTGSEGAALRIRSTGGATLIVKRIRIDLRRTPILHWRWRVDRLPEGGHEQTRHGDDFGARIYLGFSRGPLAWQYGALNYVWSREAKIGASWPNPFNAKAMMWAVEQGPGRLGKWREERHNVVEDIRHAFGINVFELEGIAVMSDADNTGSTVEARYGKIWFTER